MIIIALLAVLCINTTAQTLKAEPVTIGELQGTTMVPDEKTEVATMLIFDSSPTDRDGNSLIGFTNNSSWSK